MSLFPDVARPAAEGTKVTLARPIQSCIDWYARQSRVVRDLIVMGAIGLPIYGIAVWYDALDKFIELTNEPQNDKIDWLVLLVVFLGFAAKIYAVRRTIDLQLEVAERRKAQAEAYQLARHDVLTGLPNRRWFIEDFDKWAGPLPKGEACALLVLDLDNFKPINDVYGHRLGDEVLKVVARRLTRIAEGGSVARLGGDEFGVILRYPIDSDAPERLARRIVHELARPIPLAALSLQVGASVGVAVCAPYARGSDAMATRDGAPVETVLRQADMAMYRAKTEGRGSYRFFDGDMDDRLQQRVKPEGEIKSAIANGEIVPYYQPIVELSSRRIIGHEVLARWQHPTEGLLLPALFIPIAEDTGAIGALTDALLAQAVAETACGPSRIFLSANLSPRQFADRWLAQNILAVLARASFPPHRLVVEITETAVVRRLEEAKTTLESLRNFGVGIALDDFGTGYSGLYHLGELPIDAVKIDHSFVSHMLERRKDEKMVEAIVSLAHALGLGITAEGIETEAVRDRLIELGCGSGQGYLFGRPEPFATALSAAPDHAEVARQSA